MKLKSILSVVMAAVMLASQLMLPGFAPTAIAADAIGGGNTGTYGAAPSDSPWKNSNYSGTIPSQYTSNQAPYTWTVNTEKGGVTTLPAVVTAATGMYDNITNQNGQLINALKTVKFTDPKNMVFIISDGFGPNMLKVTEQYSRDLIINEVPNCGRSVTRSYKQSGSLSSYTTTDSGAGGTALACGIKTRYSYQAKDANGNAVPCISETLRQEFGKIIGVVSTGWAYDSTPADFGGCHDIRSNEDEIAVEMMTWAPDLFIGEGVADYRDDFNSLKKNVLKDQDIGLYTDWSQGIQAANDKVWISFSGDVRYSDSFSTARPTISQMMAYSLTWLQAKSKSRDNVGFYLMFENGMTDDAGHNKNLKQAIGETRATNEAMSIALKFACENPDTIVILTADHDTGGLTLNSGWETSASKSKFTTSGHSDQDVEVYAIGKNTKVFNGQKMENCQVGKVAAYLMGLKNFGSTDPQWSIDGIIAGIQQEVEEPTVSENRIEGKALHVMTTEKTDVLSVKLKGVSVKAHGMIELAVKVPAGAGALEFYSGSVSPTNLVMSQDADKVVNYVADYDQYQVTIKAVGYINDLVILARGDFKTSDEMVIDTVSVVSEVIDFENFSTADLETAEYLRAGITSAPVLETVTLYPDEIRGEIGDSRKVTAMFRTGSASTVNIGWSIDDENVAVIDTSSKTEAKVSITGVGTAEITVTLSNGVTEKLTVTGRKVGIPMVGDVDNDGDLDDDDAIYLLFHYFFPEDYPVKQNCDFDSNGAVDDDDAIYLLFYYFFPDTMDLPKKKTSGGGPIELPRIGI